MIRPAFVVFSALVLTASPAWGQAETDPVKEQGRIESQQFHDEQRKRTEEELDAARDRESKTLADEIRRRRAADREDRHQTLEEMRRQRGWDN